MIESRKGELFILASAGLWGFFPIFASLSFSNIPPLISLALSSLVACVFFGVVVMSKRYHVYLWNKKLFTAVIVSTLASGVGYYSLYYYGLRTTSPGNASILALSEVLASFIFFEVFHKEYIPKSHILGGLLMLSGTIIILSKNFQGFNPGDIYILLACLIAPIGNKYNRIARKLAPSIVVLLLRTGLSVIPIYLISKFIGEVNVSGFNWSVFFQIIITGILLLGVSKIFWLESIHRIPVTKALLMSSLSVIVTIIFSYIILNDPPTLRQIITLPIMFSGLYFITKKA